MGPIASIVSQFNPATTTRGVYFSILGFTDQSKIGWLGSSVSDARSRPRPANLQIIEVYPN